MKTIDMNVLVGSGLLCEFSDMMPFQSKYIGYLGAIDRAGRYECQTSPLNTTSHYYCRPLLNYWHFNDGSMVLPGELVVEFYFASTVGNIHIERGVTCVSGKIKHGAKIGERNIPYVSLHDIPAVKILGLAPGYEHEGMEVVSAQLDYSRMLDQKLNEVEV